MEKINKYLRIVFSFCLFLSLFSLFFSSAVWAADLTVDCPNAPTVCKKSGVDPLFSTAIDGYWYPGRSLTKTVMIKNSSNETRMIALKAIRTSKSGVLEKVMQFSITGNGQVIWSGSLSNLYLEEKIRIDSFGLGVFRAYNFTLTMPFGVGDEYQNQATVFDLEMGFWEEPSTLSGFLPGILGEKTSRETDSASSTIWWKLWHWLLRLLSLLKSALSAMMF